MKKILFLVCVISCTSPSQNTWKKISNTDVVNVHALAINSSGHIFAGTSGDGVFRSTDNGKRWKKMANGLTGTYVSSLVINSAGYIFALTPSDRWFRSTNNGDRWTEVNDYVDYPYVATGSNEHVFAFNFAFWDGVHESTDNGKSWTRINDGISHHYHDPIYSHAINSAGHVFAGLAKDISRSTNHGVSWVDIGNFLTYPCIAIDSREHLYAASTTLGPVHGGCVMGGRSIFRSTDDGDSWTEIYNDLTSSVYINALAMNPSGYLFVGNEDGVFRSICSTADDRVLSANELTEYDKAQLNKIENICVDFENTGARYKYIENHIMEKVKHVLLASTLIPVFDHNCKSNSVLSIRLKAIPKRRHYGYARKPEGLNLYSGARVEITFSYLWNNRVIYANRFVREQPCPEVLNDLGYEMVEDEPSDAPFDEALNDGDLAIMIDFIEKVFGYDKVEKIAKYDWDSNYTIKDKSDKWRWESFQSGQHLSAFVRDALTRAHVLKKVDR